jgi:hypothetical protein
MSDSVSLSPVHFPGEDIAFEAPVPERVVVQGVPVTDSPLPFSDDVLRSALLGVLQSATPPPLDTSHMNLTPFRNADLNLWKRPGMVHLSRRILKYRGDFYTGLLGANTVGEVKACCSQFSHQIACWLESLESAVMKLDGPTRKTRKATCLQLKHRAAGLTYTTSLSQLGTNPSVTNLLKIRVSLKELWFILNMSKLL